MCCVGTNPAGISEENGVPEETEEKTAYHTTAHGRIRGRMKRGRSQRKPQGVTEAKTAFHTSSHAHMSARMALRQKQ